MSLRVRCLNLPIATFILYTNTLPLSSTAAYELQPVSSGPFGELIKSRKMPYDIRGANHVKVRPMVSDVGHIFSYCTDMS